jgi:DNA-directed RNA polymerase I, II, and III subunit RPABC1
MLISNNMVFDIKVFRKVFYNTLDMLNDRKYDISSYKHNNKIKKFTDEELIEMYESENFNLNLKNKNDKVLVFFFFEKVGINEIKSLFEFITNENVNHIILISENILTTYAKKELNTLFTNIKVEFFLNKNLIYNVTKHVLVPKHELLTENEKEQFLLKFGKKVPHIKINDKICRYYNGQVDDVFRIYRENEIYYRLVVL